MVLLPSMYSVIYRRTPEVSKVFDRNFMWWLEGRGYSPDDYQDEFLRSYSDSMDYYAALGWIPQFEAQGVVYRRDFVFASNLIGIIDGCPPWLEEVRSDRPDIMFRRAYQMVAGNVGDK